MLDQKLRVAKDKILASVTHLVAGLGLTPNQLTLLSFALGICSGHFCLVGGFTTGLLLWWLNRLVDGLDGAVARYSQRQTDFGGYLDIICDFIVYTTIPIDLAFCQVTAACSLSPQEEQKHREVFAGVGSGCWLKDPNGEAWGPLFWLFASLSFLLVSLSPARALLAHPGVCGTGDLLR